MIGHTDHIDEFKQEALAPSALPCFISGLGICHAALALAFRNSAISMRTGKGLEVHEISLKCFSALAAEEEEKFISEASAALVNTIPSLASVPAAQLRGQVQALVSQVSVVRTFGATRGVN